MFRGGTLRRGDLHQLHFVELMNADQAARAQPRGSRLPAETRCISGVFDRQLLLRENFLPVQICDGDFRGGRQIKIVPLAAIELLFEFRELGGADERRRTDDERRRDFGVPVLRRVQIEKEIDQRPFQTCARPGVTDKSAPTDFRGPLEIKERELFADLEVCPRDEIESRGIAKSAEHRIRGSIRSARDRRIGDNGKFEQAIALLRIEIRRLCVEVGDLRSDLSRARFDFFGAFSTGFACADFLAGSFALRLQLLQVRLGRAPGFIDREHLCDAVAGIAAARREAFLDGVRVFAEQTNIEHRRRVTVALPGRQCGRNASGARSARSLRPPSASCSRA